MNDVEYPPRSKMQCSLCSRDLPKVPFTGIGWRLVALNPPNKQRTRICNDCYKEWRKTHPPQPRELNVNLINRIISVLYIVYALYGLISFMSFGVGNWMGFLSGPGLVLIVLFIFTHLFYGLLNKKIEFIPPAKSDQKQKTKWEFNFPNIVTQQPQFGRKQEVPNTLEYSACGVCHEECLDEDLFTHPDGFKICGECIKRRKR